MNKASVIGMTILYAIMAAGTTLIHLAEGLDYCEVEAEEAMKSCQPLLDTEAVLNKPNKGTCCKSLKLLSTKLAPCLCDDSTITLENSTQTAAKELSKFIHDANTMTVCSLVGRRLGSIDCDSGWAALERIQNSKIIKQLQLQNKTLLLQLQNKTLLLQLQNKTLLCETKITETKQKCETLMKEVSGIDVSYFKEDDACCKTKSERGIPCACDPRSVSCCDHLDRLSKGGNFKNCMCKFIREDVSTNKSTLDFLKRVRDSRLVHSTCYYTGERNTELTFFTDVCYPGGATSAAVDVGTPKGRLTRVGWEPFDLP